MHVSELYLQNLRCFGEKHIELDPTLNLIEGINGSGKTTLVEALYYLCYLRSFRTNLTQELISFGQESFFIKAGLDTGSAEQTTLQVGFSQARRLVKLNGKSVKSFKELISNYRVVLLTADDLNLIQGGPEVRRSFIDHYIYLQNPDWSSKIKAYQHIVDQRNALLKNFKFDLQQYQFWTNQLQTSTIAIRSYRQKALTELQQELNLILSQHFDAGLSVELIYQERPWIASLQPKEQILQRTLCGAHLEDYQIKLAARSSRKFASRGEQKLVTILLKIAQVRYLKQIFDGVIVFLLDDFITDLDTNRTIVLFDLLRSLGVQLVFTAPNLQLEHKNWLISHHAKVISI